MMKTLQEKLNEGLLTVVEVMKNEPAPVTADEILVLEQKRFDPETGEALQPTRIQHEKRELENRKRSLLAQLEEVETLLKLFSPR